jgi:ankyrin repeat protein
MHGEAATALHLAAENGHLDTIRQLLSAGADPNIHDARHDHTPAGWADHGGRMDAYDLLRAREDLSRAQSSTK